MAEVAFGDFVANCLRGVPQAFGDDSWANMRCFGKLADLALPAANENGAAAGACGGFQIGNAIADHIAIFQPDAHIDCSSLEHGDAGLTALAFLTKLTDLCVGVMQ